MANSSTAIPMTLGDHVVIGEGSVVRASSIASCVVVGRNCVLGERCIVKECVEIADGSVVASDQVLVAFSRWEGSPAHRVGMLHESFGKRVEFQAEHRFNEFIK